MGYIIYFLSFLQFAYAAILFTGPGAVHENTAAVAFAGGSIALALGRLVDLADREEKRREEAALAAHREALRSGRH